MKKCKRLYLKGTGTPVQVGERLTLMESTGGSVRRLKTRVPHKERHLQNRPLTRLVRGRHSSLKDERHRQEDDAFAFSRTGLGYLVCSDGRETMGRSWDRR